MQLRDRAILSENRQAKELLRLGREELSLSRQRAVVRDQGAFQREQLTAARRRRDARALLYTEAFGRESLFAESVNPLMALAAGKPVAPSTIVIHCFDSLRQTAWNDLRPFAPVGFLNRGHMCYVNSVSHVLLRVPAMSAWLEKHREVCAQGEGCLLCVLAATRAQLSLVNAHRSSAHLAVRRGLVGAAFANNRQHDASEFSGFLLDRLRKNEKLAGRYGLWGHLQIDASCATHAERLFATVHETRRCCKTCSMVRVWYAMAYLWPVRAAVIVGGVQTFAEAYIKSCGPGVAEVHCPGCSATTEHTVQARVMTQPNVFIVQIQRRLGAPRVPIAVEEQLELPGLSPMDLVGVIYHDGPTPDSGHYTCACRLADGDTRYLMIIHRQSL